jgi:hypothetical protein
MLKWFFINDKCLPITVSAISAEKGYLKCQTFWSFTVKYDFTTVLYFVMELLYLCLHTWFDKLDSNTPLRNGFALHL